MEVCRRSSWLLLLLGVSLLATALQGVQGEVETDGPSESECRPYIEKALKELETGDAGDTGTPEADGDSKEDVPTVEITTDDSQQHQDDDDDADGDGDDDTHEDDAVQSTESAEQTDDQHSEQEQDNTQEENSGEQQNDEPQAEQDGQSVEESDDTKEETDDGQDQEAATASVEDQKDDETASQEGGDDSDDDAEGKGQSAEDQLEDKADTDDDDDGDDANKEESVEEKVSKEEQESVEAVKDDDDSKEDDGAANTDEEASAEADAVQEDSKEADAAESKEDDQNDTKEDDKDDDKDDGKDDDKDDDQDETAEDDKNSVEEQAASNESADGKTSVEGATDDGDSKEDDKTDGESEETAEKADGDGDGDDDDDGTNEETDDDENESGEGAPVEELSLDIEIPTDLRPRDHVEQLLKLDEESSETEGIINRVAEITLRELKKLYENAIKPLEVLYKYRDLSNRHFGDAEIFSKPLILFMGPWSGGKSSIINYLLDNEYNETSLRTGAEPSPAYFNILMHGEEPEVIDGTQLAADFTFSGLQKFGQGLEERLRGVKLPSKLLERVNVVEIPGILEVRKQVSRVFPFNDACQWFIDRADIIFLVYDPSKLDVGPETEAILDQLKGREHQTRIVLNKADQVKPEELMRVQGALIWNISPLMSSAQPPVMYTTSLWSRPYEPWAPVKLLQAQERAFLRDLRTAVDKRIENKIASARRFAVRVRNHAKMVDCYLTTYYNHKSVFGNRKQVADEIIDHPQDYHIYEGLSTLTNISRYDLPDPDVYRDFFKLNPLYDFQQLSATCTYFRGCPINRLDVAIAYDLPEMVGKHKKLVEGALADTSQSPVPGS